jgi:hypothetical protein
MNRAELDSAVLGCAIIYTADVCSVDYVETILIVENSGSGEREPVYLCDENGDHITDENDNLIVTGTIKK